MDVRAEKTEAFLKDIRKRAKAEAEALDAETEKVRTLRLAEIEAEAAKKYKDYVDYEVDRIAAKTNCEAEAYQETARKALAERRQALCDCVFDRVKEKLRAYSKTEAYRAQLLADAKTLAAKISHPNPTLYMAQADLSLSEDVQKAFEKACTVEADDDIRLGGLKGLDLTERKVYDFTLDTALEDERIWFLEHSGLGTEA